MASKFHTSEICTHKFYDYSERTFVAYYHKGFPVTHRGRNARLCDWCYKPFLSEWKDHLQECESCFGEFSSPTGELCKRCAAIEEENYFGWSDLSRVARQH